MKLPTTVKGYLKMLVAIANDDVYSLNKFTEEERELIANIRADIQNELSEDTFSDDSILKKHNLKY